MTRIFEQLYLDDGARHVERLAALGILHAHGQIARELVLGLQRPERLRLLLPRIRTMVVLESSGRVLEWQDHELGMYD